MIANDIQLKAEPLNQYSVVLADQKNRSVQIMSSNQWISVGGTDALLSLRAAIDFALYEEPKNDVL